MKKLFTVVLILMCITGCWKGESPRKTTAQEALLTPPSPESDQAVNSALKNFSDKSFKPLSTYYWYDPGKPKVMMLFSKPGDGSHVSSAQIGGLFAEYDGETKKWEIKALSPAFAENGSWGQAPEPRFIKLGSEKYGFIMEPAYTGQGYTQQALFVYGVIGNNFVEMLKIPSYSDNGGTGADESEMYTVKVNLYQIIDNKKEFYDMRARLFIRGKYSMTPDDDLSKVFGNAKEVGIVFKNGVYVVAGSNARPN
jgi:hypothetical protein